MSDVIWNEIPVLRRPLLLAAFNGLFDAGEAATHALTWIRERSDVASVARLDGEPFYNYAQVRPMVRFDDNGDRVIDWPEANVWACMGAGPRDLLIMTGPEPHLRWASFADAILDVARRTGAEMVATIGSMVSVVPHDRPFPVTGSAGNPELARRLNLDRPSYQGPTGIAGVINTRLERAGLPVISLRVAVPHYVPAAPSPKATRALLRRIQQTTAVPTGFEELDESAAEWTRRVDEAVQSDPETRSYVQRLQKQADSNEDLLPTGDDLADELESFLRDHQRRTGDSEESGTGSSDETRTDETGSGEGPITGDDTDDGIGED